jgi:hypothetical protein
LDFDFLLKSPVFLIKLLTFRKKGYLMTLFKQNSPATSSCTSKRVCEHVRQSDGHHFRQVLTPMMSGSEPPSSSAVRLGSGSGIQTPSLFYENFYSITKSNGKLHA